MPGTEHTADISTDQPTLKKSDQEDEIRAKIHELHERQQEILDRYDPNVNHPAHYNAGEIEVIDAIAEWGFLKGFCLGNTIKYIARHEVKHRRTAKRHEDLRKAKWYLDFYLRWIEEGEKHEKDGHEAQ